MSVFSNLAADLSKVPAADIEWFTVALHVHTDDARSRAYVADQHHAAASSITPSARSDITLYATANRQLLDHIGHSVAGQVVIRRESFAEWWYDCWSTADGDWIEFAGKGHEHAHALLSRDFRAWAVVVADPHDLGVVVTRTIRELVRESLLDYNALMLHAASAVLPGGAGLVLAGASAAGKTSTAVHVARAGGHCIGTDRTLVLPMEEAWVAVGLPMSTRLGLGAIHSMGVVDELRRRSLIRHEDGFVNSHLNPDLIQFGSKTKLSFSNAEVLAFFGGGFCPAARIDAVVLLAYHQHNTPVLIRLEEPQQAADALREHVLTPDPAYRSRWLTREGTPETQVDAPAQLADFVARCRVAQLTWNPASHGTDEIVGWLSKTLA